MNENYDLISTSSLSDNENEEEEEEEDKRQIKPTIKNLIISNDSITTSYEPMSYTISFNKDNSNSLNNAKPRNNNKTDKTIKTGKKTPPPSLPLLLLLVVVVVAVKNLYRMIISLMNWILIIFI